GRRRRHARYVWASDDSGTRTLLGDRLPLARVRGETESPSGNRRHFLGAAAAALAAAGFGVRGGETQPRTRQPTELLHIEGNLPPLDGAIEWLNSAPLTAGGLRGKVVLVNFWTYTCINWLRQLPYVRGWADKYKDQGLVVIGVHTPE